MKLFCKILVVAVTLSSVAWAAPSRRKLNKKFTRQTEEQPIPVVPVATLQAAQSPDVTWKPDTTTTTTPPKVAVIEPETVSLSPVGDPIESSQPTESTSLKTVVQGQDQSTPSTVDKEAPAGGNAPPPPQVQLPTVNLAGGLPPPPRPGSEGRPPLPPGGPGASPPPPPPPTTTKKPGDEDDSSSEEDGDGANEGDEDDTSADDEDEDEEDEEEEEDEEARKLARKESITITKRVGRQEDSAEVEPDLSRNLDAFIPGYISEEGEIFVPIDTVDQGVPYTIIPDRAGGQGRVGILLDDAGSDDGDDATTSEEEDEPQPVRISSFQLIYDKKKKNKDQEGKDKEEDADDDDDDETNEDDTNEDEEEETGEGGESVEEKENVIKTEENRPPPPIIPEKVPSLASVSPGTTEPGSPNVDKPLKLNPLRPPPLSYVQATKPTNEDDENELRYFRHLLPVGPPPPQHYNPEYYNYNPYFFNEPPTLRNGYYFDRVNVLRRRHFH